MRYELLLDEIQGALTRRHPHKSHLELIKGKGEFTPHVGCEEVLSRMRGISVLNTPAPIMNRRKVPAGFFFNEEVIRTQPRENFTTAEDYYKVIYHEQIHATATRYKLNRGYIGRFPIYNAIYGEIAIEELVAEIGALMLCQETSLTMLHSNLQWSLSYLDNWKTSAMLFSSDVREAGLQARDAVNYLLQRSI